MNALCLRGPSLARRFGSPLLIPIALTLATAVAAAAQDDVRSRPPASGFAEPVAMIPEIGLWADGLAELGYAQKPGLVVWWDLQGPPAGSPLAGSKVDWQRVTYRLRVEVFDARGHRVGREQELVEPKRVDAFAERGGFPTPLHLVLPPGEYRVRLEAYPLISAAAAGLDSVPRGEREITAVIPAKGSPGSEWRVSDLLFLRGLRNWEQGAAGERTWYEWVISPSVPRVFEADSSAAYLAFEILRGEETVPRCRLNNCRVVVTVLDAEGGVIDQALRAVPQAKAVNAYVVPLTTAGWEPGDYRAEIDVYEGGQLIATVSRSFRVRAPAG